MKLMASVSLIVALLLLGVSWSIHRQLVWQYDTTYLMWSSERAYLFVSRRNEGWSGNLIELAWQLARGSARLSGGVTHRTWWLEVTELTTKGVVRKIVPSNGSIAPAVYGGHIYAMYNGVLSQWDDASFHAVAPEKVASVQQSMRGGEFTNVEEWSSLYNIDNRAAGERTYPLVTGGVVVDVIVSQRSDRRTVSAKFPGKPTEVLLDLPTGVSWVDALAFAKLLEPPLPR